jgi:hypothetical protein
LHRESNTRGLFVRISMKKTHILGIGEYHLMRPGLVIVQSDGLRGFPPRTGCARQQNRMHCGYATGFV